MQTPRDSPSQGEAENLPNPFSGHKEAPRDDLDQFDHDPLIKHRLEYKSTISENSAFFDNYEHISSDIEPYVLEYIDVRLTNEAITPNNSEHNTSNRPHETSKGHSYLRIVSPAVCEALRAVVDYFPELNLSTRIIEIREPFAVFVFYEKELEEYCQRLEQHSTSQKSPSCPNRYAAKHIRIAQDFVRRQVQADVDAERERYSRGYCTYRMLWLLFRPGSDMYVDLWSEGEYTPYVFSEMEFAVENGSILRYEIYAWNMDAIRSWVGPANRSWTRWPFTGEKQITSLDAFPCEYLRFREGMTDDAVQHVKKFFIDRGRQWYDLRRSVQCYSFDGVTHPKPRRHINGFVMVDPARFAMRFLHHSATVNEGTAERVVLLPSVDRPCHPLKICTCDWCQETIYSRNMRERFEGYIDISTAMQEILTDHQYFLCDASVEAFVFKTRKWELLDVSGINKASFDKGLIDHLVMKSETKSLIKNLVQAYITDNDKALSQGRKLYINHFDVHKRKEEANAESTWAADLIRGKGEGLTFLLHGKPGVGKTYTAECIAELTGRPLLFLTCADIGVNPKHIEDNLVTWFKRAEGWNAILLIDEADLYMEERQVQDIERNHLVAGFLRALEYYKGILFLTTNRVGTFDEAFISRIHVKIYYADFSDDDRSKVWNTFFEKLEEDRDTTMRIPQSTKDYVESEELRKLKWNGREIRNAFQIAVALAESQGHKDKQGRTLIKSDHLKATVQMSREFRTYMSDLRKDESKRAAMMGIRNDAFNPSSSNNEVTENY